MVHSALFWLLLTLCCILVGAFFSGIEMSIVSFNKVRLQYYVSQGNRRALWVNWLLQHPSHLFGTTLIGVTSATLLGSECARQLYHVIGLPPELAMVTQIPITIIFAELAPIFAARRYPEHLSLLGSPLVYASAKCLAPAIWAISLVARFSNWLVGGKEVKNEGFISRDELELILETRDREPLSASETEELNLLARNIFTLREKTAIDAMVPLSTVRKVPSSTTVGHLRQILIQDPATFLPIFHGEPTNIVGIAFARDLIKTADTQRVRDYARPPWFITQKMALTQILQQFRNNKQSVAIVLNDQGRGIGLLTLDDAIEELFPQINAPIAQGSTKTIAVDRIFPGEMRVADFNAQFGVRIKAKPEITFSQLLEESLGHHPEAGESITIDQFRISVQETSLLNIKKVRVQTR